MSYKNKIILPSSYPSKSPTYSPRLLQTENLTSTPSSYPSDFPSYNPINFPSFKLSLIPNTLPGFQPSTRPSSYPSGYLTYSPSMSSTKYIWLPFKVTSRVLFIHTNHQYYQALYILFCQISNQVIFHLLHHLAGLHYFLLRVP